MLLNELINYIQPKEISGATDITVYGISANSKTLKKGDIFICYAGGNHDSHEDIAEAIKKGAVAIVCEYKTEDCPITQVIVKDGRACVAILARVFYGFPDKNLKMVAVTGTNGKTTTTYMLESIFKENGCNVGVIGTLGIKYGEKFIYPELTTPDPVYLFSVLADMVKDNVEYVFMEVSAHALYYDKIFGIVFEAGIFTNCTQDHLDFFGNMEEYARCKKLLFKGNRCKYAIVNSDDRLGVELTSELKNVFSFGINNPADVFAVDIRESLDGTEFVINIFDELYDVKLQLPAIYNVYNAMGAAACARKLGVKTSVIAKGLSKLKNVSGRLERVAHYNGAEIFVDFAHTPDGLEKSLKSLKKLCKGKLYCVFGCGGNRDRAKRPIMGKVAANEADFCVLTSDNPRYEDPYDIIREIEEGIKPTQKSYVTVTERDIAIEYTIRLLTEGDIMLVAGKGGEHYQEIMGIKHSFNDNIIIKKIIGD